MTLKTGRTEAGFSMIELMLTVVFVAMGSLVMQGSFMRSSDMFGRFSHTLKIMDWMNAKSSAIKESILYSGEESESGGSGEVVLGGKPFDWECQVQPLSTPNLSTIQCTAKWTESGRPMELKNELYVYKKDLLPES